MDGIRQAIVMDERVRVLSERVNQIDARLADTRERLIAIETLLNLIVRRDGAARLIGPAG